MSASRRRTVTLGSVLVVLLLAVSSFIVTSFGGAFTQYDVVRCQLPELSTAVPLNAPVEYRNVTVGSVASEGTSAPGGLVVLVLHMKPSMLADIPASVQATETPVSFFGDPYIVLQPPANAGTARLLSGATIPALTSGQTASLQATLGDLDTLLLGLHPAELDSALTAVAGALQGQGTSLGQNLDKANAYFSQMLKLWPTVVDDLKMLVPVSNQFASSSSDILQILSNQTTTGSTITAEAGQLRQALGGGATTAADLSELLNAIQQPYSILAADSGPFLNDISQSPTEISQLLSGLDAWARAWTAAEASGPYLTLSTDVEVANPADLGTAVLGGPQMVDYLSAGLGPGYVNPQTYTSAGSIPSANSARLAAAALARTIAGQPQPVMSVSAQSAAVDQIYSALSGSKPASPAVTTLLLSPVLSSMVAAR